MVVCSRPSQPGSTDEVEPAQHGEHDHLEDRVQRDQHGGGLAVAAGQVVPDDDHRDAAGQADDDQPGAVLGQVGQQQPGQGEHQRRAEHPVQHQRADQELAVAGDGVEAVVADLGQHRIHHDQQTERDGQRNAVDLERFPARVQSGNPPPEQQSGDHRDADPHRQEPIQGRQLADDGGCSVVVCRSCRHPYGVGGRAQQYGQSWAAPRGPPRSTPTTPDAPRSSSPASRSTLR